MSDEPRGQRREFPIERGFPIEQVNDLADREGRAKLHYRPLTTMHKWWARRLGSVFRAICLYSLVDDASAVTVSEPDSLISGEGNATLDGFDGDSEEDKDHDFDVERLLSEIDLETPDALWDLYSKDVRVSDKKVLDPFMGGGTSLLEAIRFDTEVTGIDLNPVAWLITKKELEAHSVEPSELQNAFGEVRDAVAEDLQSHYETACPADHDHTADIVYALWARELDCTSCGETIPLFKDYRVAEGRYENDDKHCVYCPECGDVFLTDDYTTETVCSECGHEYVPENGTVASGGNYSCPTCGLRYPIVDAIADGQAYSQQLYAIEYYCTECEDEGKTRTDYKGFKPATDEDVQKFKECATAFDEQEELHQFVPQGDIPRGAITTASSISGNDVFQHGFETWQDMFNDRQLYCLSTLLSAINDIEDQTIQEYLLLAFSDSLMFQNTFAPYNVTGTKIEGIFRRNSYTPLVEYAENNVWGTRAGRGTFRNTWDKVIDGIEFAHEPVERYLDAGELTKSEPFQKPIGGEYTLHQDDVREMDLDDDYDAIITDPPYYDNVVYSEVSDFFYVWQRLLLADEYSSFDAELTPREESIVKNPSLGKSAADYETELQQSISQLRQALTDDGILVFTYRHEGHDSWGALLEALGEEGFDVTATYPISANLREFVAGEELNFSVVVVARPAGDREPTSWSALRRKMHRSAQEARNKLERGQMLSEGDISIVEMGVCFREYFEHYGKVHRHGELMAATEVVKEIYEIITGEVEIDDIYMSLLSLENPTVNDARRLCRGTSIGTDDLRERGLLSEDGFQLLTWHDEARQSYLQQREPEELTNMEKLHLLRQAAAEQTRTQNHLDEWEVTGELIDLAEELATLTEDSEYRQLLRD